MTVAEREKARKAELKLGKRLEKHSGEWVAIRDHSIVAHAATLSELLERIDASAVDRIMHVATEDTAIRFF